MRSVATTFSKAADTYNNAARIQHWAARILAETLHEYSTILDIGAGTGVLQSYIKALHYISCDISLNLLRKNNGQCIVSDMHSLPFQEKFDCVISNLALHWSHDPAMAINALWDTLKPGGTLAFTVMAPNSFQEWRTAGLELGFPQYTSLEIWQHYIPASSQGHTIEKTFAYETPLAFLQSLKETGTTTPRPSYNPMPPGTLRKKLYNAPTDITWSIHLITAKKP